MSLTPDIISQIHSASMANIARKVKEKQQLTTAEWRQLNDAKRAAGNDMMTNAKAIIEDGLLAMHAIKDIIEKSKLTAKEKESIYEQITNVVTKCNQE